MFRIGGRSFDEAVKTACQFDIKPVFKSPIIKEILKTDRISGCFDELDTKETSNDSKVSFK